MQSLVGIILILVLTTPLASAKQHCSKSNLDRSSGSCTVPDPALTPGEMEDLLPACRIPTVPATWPRPRRKRSSPFTGGQQAHPKPWASSTTGCLTGWGGLDTGKNIWFEPHAGKFGSLMKDKFELLLYRKVCVDKRWSSQRQRSFTSKAGRNLFRNSDWPPASCGSYFAAAICSAPLTQTKKPPDESDAQLIPNGIKVERKFISKI